MSFVGRDGSEIEVLFVERIAQLLKPQGIAAVILPSSILSNDSNSYIGAREEIFKHFYVRAIVSFGSKTFGATNTNTVVMFLEKYNEPPKKMNLMRDTVAAILDDSEYVLTDWTDYEIFEQYVKVIGLTPEQYRKFVTRRLTLDELQDNSYFKMYVSAFENSAEWKNQVKKKTYQKMSEEEQLQLKLSKLYTYIRKTEGDKLYYFSLTYEQKTVIIKTPTDDKAQKEFLGYDWSRRKGNEGIQIINAGGKMYNDADRRDDTTLAAAIRHSFMGEIPTFTEEQSAYCSIAATSDMLDFSRSEFNKQILLTLNTAVTNSSKYKTVQLSEVVDSIGGLWTGKKPPYITAKVIRNTNFTKNGKLVLEDVATINVEEAAFKKRQLKYGDIIVEKSGGSNTQAVGRVVIYELNDSDFSFSNFTVKFRVVNPNILSKYLYLILNQYYQMGKTFGYQNGSTGLKNLNMPMYMTLPIPIPPLEIQQQIVDECAKIDEEYESTRMNIDEYNKKVQELFEKLDIIAKSGGGIN